MRCGTRLNFPRLSSSVAVCIVSRRYCPLLDVRGLKQAVLRILRAGVHGIEITVSVSFACFH